MGCEISLLDKTRLIEIKELWEKLNEIHLNDSHYFKDHYRNFTFEKRCLKFYGMDDGKIRIEVAEDDGKKVGYCISIIEEDKGEIDSLFVEEAYRKYGFGSRMVKNGIAWLKENNCKIISVAVAEGHESVFGFYRKHNFYPRMTYLQLKE